jgi:nucleoside-diphosphate-sugar epimerase
MLDTSRANERFGFEAEWSLDRGLETTIAWYRANEEAILKRESS